MYILILHKGLLHDFNSLKLNSCKLFSQLSVWKKKMAKWITNSFIKIIKFSLQVNVQTSNQNVECFVIRSADLWMVADFRDGNSRMEMKKRQKRKNEKGKSLILLTLRITRNENDEVFILMIMSRRWRRRWWCEYSLRCYYWWRMRVRLRCFLLDFKTHRPNSNSFMIIAVWSRRRAIPNNNKKNGLLSRVKLRENIQKSTYKYFILSTHKKFSAFHILHYICHVAHFGAAFTNYNNKTNNHHLNFK